MKNRNWTAVVVIAAALAISAAPAHAQGKGKGGGGGGGAGHGKGGGGAEKVAHQPQGKPDHAPGGQGAPRGDKGNGKSDHGNAARGNSDHAGKAADHAAKAADHADFKRFAGSNRTNERVAAGALSHAYRHGVDRNDFVINTAGDRVRITNRSGQVLVDLDDERARNLGAWDVRPVNYNVAGNAPSFCRSGAGHPVWGRQWCIDKGFGLGTANDIRWGRTSTLENVIFGNVVDSRTLARDALVSMLGNVVLDRLGLHAVTLGYSQPLTGVWLGEPTGPRVLQLNSGTYPVAEIVDANRDNRADVLVVALRPY